MLSKWIVVDAVGVCGYWMDNVDTVWDILLHDTNADHPGNVQICQKAFKRPQDLKKHEKVHAQPESSADVPTTAPPTLSDSDPNAGLATSQSPATAQKANLSTSLPAGSLANTGLALSTAPTNMALPQMASTSAGVSSAWLNTPNIPSCSAPQVPPGNVTLTSGEPSSI
jgi:hypothetical protein